MKNSFKLLSIFFLVFFNSCRNHSTSDQYISFYKVPLVCGAAPEIGCGSRIKPFFIDTEKNKNIKESWSDREGTVIAIVWSDGFSNENKREELIRPIFKKHEIDARLIGDAAMIAELRASMEKDKWYKGMAVDSLSFHEAGVIAEDLTEFAREKGLINDAEKQVIKKDLEAYFRKELVIVRTEDELTAAATQDRWYKEGVEIYAKHIGRERAEKAASYFGDYQAMKAENLKKAGKESCCEKKESCCEKGGMECLDKNDPSLRSEITCPACGYKSAETMPTGSCQLSYTCKSCKKVMQPKNGDCCVYCSYGDYKCPSKQ
jgi:hypothetical protein